MLAAVARQFRSINTSVNALCIICLENCCLDSLEYQNTAVLCPQAHRLLLRAHKGSIGEQAGESKALGVVLTGGSKGLGWAAYHGLLLKLVSIQRARQVT